MKGLLRPRSLGMILLALVMGAAVHGFAAANTVNPTYAGDGSAAINGYTVTKVDYILAGTPSDIDRVDITLNAAAGQVHIQLNAAGAWTSCALSGGVWQCDLSPNQTVLSAANLRVVAVE